MKAIATHFSFLNKSFFLIENGPEAEETIERANASS